MQTAGGSNPHSAMRRCTSARPARSQAADLSRMRVGRVWLRRVSRRQGFASMKSFPFTLCCSMCCWQNMPSYRFQSLLQRTVACTLCEGQCSLNGESMMDQGLFGDQRRGAGNSGAVPVCFSSVRFLANMCEHGGSKSRSVTPLRMASCPYELQPCQHLSCCVACALPAVEIAERVIHPLIPAARGLRHIILFDLT